MRMSLSMSLSMSLFMHMKKNGCGKGKGVTTINVRCSNQATHSNFFSLESRILLFDIGIASLSNYSQNPLGRTSPRKRRKP